MTSLDGPWKTRDGRFVPLADMTPSHLERAANHLRARADAFETACGPVAPSNHEASSAQGWGDALEDIYAMTAAMRARAAHMDPVRAAKELA